MSKFWEIPPIWNVSWLEDNWRGFDKAQSFQDPRANDKQGACFYPSQAPPACTMCALLLEKGPQSCLTVSGTKLITKNHRVDISDWRLQDAPQAFKRNSTRYHLFILQRWQILIQESLKFLAVKCSCHFAMRWISSKQQKTCQHPCHFNHYVTPPPWCKGQIHVVKDKFWNWR